MVQGLPSHQLIHKGQDSKLEGLQPMPAQHPRPSSMAASLLLCRQGPSPPPSMFSSGTGTTLAFALEGLVQEASRMSV